MGIVEAWGTGIRRIKESAENYGLPIPEIQVFDDMFRVNLFRDQPLLVSEFGVNFPENFPRIVREDLEEDRNRNRKGSEKVRRKFGEEMGNKRKRFGESSEKELYGLSEIQRKLLKMIHQNNRISAKVIGEELSVSSRSIEKNIILLRDRGILIRHGSPQSGYWEIVKNKTKVL